MTKRAGRIVAVTVALAVGGGLVMRPSPVTAKSVAKETQERLIRGINYLLSSWRLREAAMTLQTFHGFLKSHPDTMVVRARLFYLRGEYAKANEVVKGVDRSTLSRGAKRIARRIQRVYLVTKSYKRHRTADGRFEIAYPPGEEAILLPYAEAALRVMRLAVKRELGMDVDGRVRVEILPSAEALAVVSPLSSDEVRRTGTIALCIDHRLMLVTPRAMLTGYGWLDTLAHEYIHYVLKVAAPMRVPLWLHEGMARFAQELWRRSFPTKLTPMQAHLLASALKRNALVPLRRMEPSMAKLKDHREAAQAFAQVASMVMYLYQEKGSRGLRQLIRELAKERPIDKALQKVSGVPLPKFLKRWEARLRKMGLKVDPDLTLNPMRFKKPGTQPSVHSMLAKQSPAKRYRRLGAILRSRGRPRAAIVEYRKAHGASGGKDGQVANTLARLLLGRGRPSEAAKVAEASTPFNEDLASLHVVAGQALSKLKKWAEAAAYFLAANRVDPFDPAIHCGLALAYQGLGKVALAARETGFCTRLNRSP